MLKNFYKTVLYLQDGKYYKGWSFFQSITSCGEIVFNTGMTGYQEIITDPSYSGQMVIFTYPEIGNTGLNYQDSESNFIHITGLIGKNISNFSNNWRSNISLKKYIIKKSIPHIFGIDTRSLTKHLRSVGVMHAAIISINQNLTYESLDFKSKELDNLNLARRLTAKNAYYVDNLYNFNNWHLDFKQEQSLSSNYTILVIDFGVKFNIIRRLLSIGCHVIVIPATYNYKTILEYKPDGFILSNGPGNPILIKHAIITIKKLIYFSNIPIFGICMGHHLLNLALGVETFKLKFGHRGLNHPVGLGNYAEITSQNHGFAISNDSFDKNNLNKILRINNFNLNDFTVSSVIHYKLPAFSVQYHPEASPGPHDSDYLFTLFIELVKLIKQIN
uniref:Carbamoyl phosphate synthase small chain n=1 Tax=Sonderella linearis TaxID=110477 RepID=A0A1Z1MM67_9FLOR|nr:carbamoyl phosphate synthase small subunit [Sonderella linearis]ARW66949.1 carbamoyl phosphate synthase small subunit [Sonderella linearis]